MNLWSFQRKIRSNFLKKIFSEAIPIEVYEGFPGRISEKTSKDFIKKSLVIFQGKPMKDSLEEVIHWGITEEI